jgi:23S rRNA (cytidine1920-2'-O)/16S rRNA (cytidine1409-2'-O)-methyltransferase
MKRQRIDKLLVERGLADSRTKAQALVMSGVVLADEKRVDKSSEMVDPEVKIRLKGSPEETKYVGRGGLKLERAILDFHIRIDGYVCLDVGSSTGGFTDCLLKHGAAKVYAVDAGTNQLVWALRNNPRVVTMENTNARHLKPDDFECRFDLVTIDVSFISVTKILPALVPLMAEDGRIVVLVKPQFEVGRGEVGKGGIVKDEAKRARVVDEIRTFAESVGLKETGLIESPIKGAEGNVEFLMKLSANRDE